MGLVRGVFLDYFKSYMEDRKQFTIVNKSNATNQKLSASGICTKTTSLSNIKYINDLLKGTSTDI